MNEIEAIISEYVTSDVEKFGMSRRAKHALKRKRNSHPVKYFRPSKNKGRTNRQINSTSFSDLTENLPLVRMAKGDPYFTGTGMWAEGSKKRRKKPAKQRKQRNGGRT
ncbi:hypothetical protein UFOVP1279_2 [uncultured Caudovirales phage]|uniref:Uncharacterized protein n=1 Tax=uncultured Caudovirales phage TaxID=2100421 RepID=A0A6J5RKM7_9CAUD|nr:hypothetical protein UFOVP1279_2 [uncultured Caudovirales phage]